MCIRDRFYIVIDPSAYADAAFYEHLASLAESIAAQPGTRLPGQASVTPESVEVEDDVWQAVQNLAAS